VAARRLHTSQPLKRAIYLAVLAGVLIIVSGVLSSSVLLTALQYVDTNLGPTLGPSGQSMLESVTSMLRYVVGFGGLLDFAGAYLLWTRHGSSGRFLIGLGGGTAIIGLLLSLVRSGSESLAPVLYQPYFTLYWIGAILATAAILYSRKAPGTKPMI
jgi:hypothetical protein